MDIDTIIELSEFLYTLSHGIDRDLNELSKTQLIAILKEIQELDSDLFNAIHNNSIISVRSYNPPDNDFLDIINKQSEMTALYFKRDEVTDEEEV